jgi:hypothetical protein
MNHPARADRESYRLIVTRRNGSEILFPSRGSSGSLPCVEILATQRVAEQLVTKTYAELGLRTYCLFVLPHSQSQSGTERTKCAVMETLEDSQGVPASHEWFSVEGGPPRFANKADGGDALTEALREMDLYVANTKLGPFAQAGWIEELFAWVQRHIDLLGLRVTRGIRQFNASPAFSLIRLETTGPALWFKATGDPNRRELPISMSLARLFRGYVPAILGVHLTWNGWLSEEVSGTMLDDLPDSSAWGRTAETLAELQIASINKTEELLESQCKDLTLPRLIESIDPFLARMIDLMAVQEKRHPEPLSVSDISLLGQRLKDACSLLLDLGLPETLGHLDFNPCNTIVSTQRCVFIDWAEACVSTPFITFEYLRAHMHCRNLSNMALLDEIVVAAYLGPWRSFLSQQALHQTMAVSPMIAVFTFAVALDGSRSSSTALTPATAGYFRGLTRRMFSESSRLTAAIKPAA